jgi:hypothetical protein
MARSICIAAILLAVAAGSAGAAGTSGKAGFFKTQNGRIYCGWGTGKLGFVVCGIKNGKLNPKPKNNCSKFHVDYVGNRITFTAKSKARVQACAGDAGPFANPKAATTLAAGKTWSKGGFSCKATKSSVTCKNPAKHSFTLNTNGKYTLT